MRRAGTYFTYYTGFQVRCPKAAAHAHQLPVLFLGLQLERFYIQW